MRKLFAGFLVAVILLSGDLIFRAWAQTNTFCAANTACSVTALWNFTTGNLTYNGAAPATLPVNLAGGAGVVTGVLPGANMAATNLAGGNNPGGVAGVLPLASGGLGVGTITALQGSDTSLLSSGTVSASSGVALCTDANHGATTSGCPGGASGFKIECASVTPVTVANTVTQTSLITCTIPANEIGVAQWFYIDAFGVIGDTAAPTCTLAFFLDAVSIGTFSPTLGAATNQPWALHAWFNGITTGAGGTISGTSVQWMSTPSGGGGGTTGTLVAANDNFSGVGAPAQTVTVDTTTSHVLSIKVTWGVANASNTITQNNMMVHRLN